MADEQDKGGAMEALRAEMASLRSQIENIVKSVEEKSKAETSDLTRKLKHELERLREGARENYHKIYEAGQNGLEDVSGRVRSNPLASVMIAFGAGCILSCLLHRLR